MKKSIYLVLPLLLVLTACLDSTGSEEPLQATGEIEASLTNEATEEPLANFDFFVFLEVTGFTQPTSFGDFQTNENGFMSTEIYSFNTDHITKMIIQYDVGGETRTAERDIDLKLRFNPPFDSVSVEFELDVSE